MYANGIAEVRLLILRKLSNASSVSLPERTLQQASVQSLAFSDSAHPGDYTDRSIVYYLPDPCGEGRVVGHDLQLVPELAEIHADVRSRHGQISAWYTITVRILDNGN